MPTEVWVVFVTGAATVGYVVGRLQNIDKARLGFRHFTTRRG